MPNEGELDPEGAQQETAIVYTFTSEHGEEAAKGAAEPRGFYQPTSGGTYLTSSVNYTCDRELLLNRSRA